MIETKTPIIETVNLKKYFDVGKKKLHAVDGVNLKIMRGKTIGVVGESGCGKSTLGRVILRLLEPTDGDILFDGESIINYNKKEMKKMRRKVQMIFQDPYSSINPRMTVSELIAEYMIVNKIYKSTNEVYKRVGELMDTVGLARRVSNSYPHELDGGRRQRIGIARALSLSPEFIVCDEPVSALDVSIQAQILNLLMDLQEEFNLAYLFVTHDLSVVKHISDDILVMYLGQGVEQAPSQDLFDNPMHPYTRALLDAIPEPILTEKSELKTIKGEVTSPIDPAVGCRFAPRCEYKFDECTKKNPEQKYVAANHSVACPYFVENMHLKKKGVGSL
ncbi:MAG TPA: ABC transporter ATP-binding protein [Tissierellaceae bacterium]|nr:ABC transporter ATP-binding protein [Tissierellaceae bacterium]